MDVVEKIDRMIAGLDTFRMSMWEITVSYCMDRAEELVEKNREQLSLGLMPDGTDIAPLYSDWYALDIKRRDYRYKNPAKNPYLPDLTLTGEFYDSLYLYADTETLTISSTDAKWDEPVSTTWIPHNYGDMSLRERYGEVLGIPDDYYGNTLIPEVKESLTDTLRNLMN